MPVECLLLVSCAWYWFHVFGTGFMCLVLVLLVWYWFCVFGTGFVRLVLVSCAWYWFRVLRTGFVCFLLGKWCNSLCPSLTTITLMLALLIMFLVAFDLY